MRSRLPVSTSGLLILATFAAAFGWAKPVPAQHADWEMKVHHTMMAGVPQYEVPGFPGQHFIGLYNSSASLNGLHYAMVAAISGSPSTVLIVDGHVLLSEGQAAPWAPSEYVFNLSTREVAIDDFGQVVINCRTTGGSVSADNYIVRSKADGNDLWEVLKMESSPVTNLPAYSYNYFTYPTVDSIGGLGFLANDISGAPNAEDDILEYQNTIVAQEGVDAPLSQMSGLNEVYGGSFSQFQVNSGGLDWTTLATLTPNANRVLVHNNEVKVQTGYSVPGTSLPAIQAIENAGIDGAGRWYSIARIASNNGQACLRDGAVIAQSDMAVWPGAGESWAPTMSFSVNRGNTKGDYFVVGNVGNFPTWTPALVHNGSEFLWRYNDQVDVDGNGLYDDNTVVMSFVGPGVADELGGLWCTAALRNTITNQYGASWVHITPAPPRLKLLNLVAGQAAELKVSNAEPGAYVYTGFSLKGAGPTPVNSPWGTLQIAMSAPFVQLPVMLTDAQGEASYSQTIPANAIGVQVWAHAVVWLGTSVWLTNPVSEVVM